MNVSSIVVRTAPENSAKVIESINALENCEVHFHDAEGRVVATLVGEEIQDQMNLLKRVQAIPNVLNAHLAYTYCEDEITRLKGSILEQ